MELDDITLSFTYDKTEAQWEKQVKLGQAAN